MRASGILAAVAAATLLSSTALADEHPLRQLPRTMSLFLSPDQEAPQDPEAETSKLQEPEEDPASGLLDFGRLELNPRIGVLFFSSDFEADPAFSGGIGLRAPSPWVSRDLFGFETDRIGAWLDVTISSIDRDLPALADPKGVLVIAGAGPDITLYGGDVFVFRAQTGIQYGYMGGVDDLDDGVAFVVGASASVRVAESFRITFNPQAAFADSGNRIFFLHLGVTAEF